MEKQKIMGWDLSESQIKEIEDLMSCNIYDLIESELNSIIKELKFNI